MSDTNEIQATEDLTVHGDQAAASADGLVIDNANDNAEQESGFDIVLSGDETKQDPAEAKRKGYEMRLERKRQRELEQQAEAVQRGELPENLRVAAELPAQPNANDFFSDEALEKYGYDQVRANAAFQQANNEWLVKAQDARSNAVAEQGRRTQQFTQQSGQIVEAARKHYDAAEKLNLPDYQAKEDVFRQVAPGYDVDIMRLFPEKSAAIMYHLGRKPREGSTNPLDGSAAPVNRNDAALRTFNSQATR